MASGEMVIACAADARFVRPLAAMLQSTLAHADPGGTPVIYVLHDDIGDDDRERMASSWGRRATVHWIRPDDRDFDGLPLWGRMSVTTYYKLALPTLLPDTVGKVIWLDSDLIVNRDLLDLWSLPLNGHLVLAVPDSIVPRVSSRFGVAGFRELGLPPDAKYFNAGVMLVDLDAWRSERVVPRAMAYLKARGSAVYFWDQEGLNAILAGRWGELDARWNQTASAEPNDEPWIVHFTGGLKPWTCETRDPHCRLYFRYLDLTAWSGWRPEGGVLRRVLGLYAGSRWRRHLRPVERWRMQVTRRMTQAPFRPRS